jgi:hypothetical protein
MTDVDDPRLADYTWLTDVALRTGEHGLVLLAEAPRTVSRCTSAADPTMAMRPSWAPG